MTLTPKVGYTVVNEGDKIVFDFSKQAWFKDEGQDLDAQRFTARAIIKQDIRYETTIGLRSHNANFEVTERAR